MGSVELEPGEGGSGVEVSADPADVESVTIRYLMYVLLPAWFVPSVADYDLAHATRTTGWRS